MEERFPTESAIDSVRRLRPVQLLSVKSPTHANAGVCHSRGFAYDLSITKKRSTFWPRQLSSCV